MSDTAGPQVSRERTLDAGWYAIEQYAVLSGPEPDARVVPRLSVRRGNRVAVLPYRSTDLSIVLTEQFRLPAWLAGALHLSVEAPGGLVEDAEVEASARSEVLEETGLVVESLEACGITFLNPGLVAERTHLYLAPLTALPVSDAPTGVPEEGEGVRCSVWSWERAWRAVDEGRISDAKTVLLMLQLRLRASAGDVQSDVSPARGETERAEGRR